jgi:hypothetical protein
LQKMQAVFFCNPHGEIKAVEAQGQVQVGGGEGGARAVIIPTGPRGTDARGHDGWLEGGAAEEGFDPIGAGDILIAPALVRKQAGLDEGDGGRGKPADVGGGGGGIGQRGDQDGLGADGPHNALGAGGGALDDGFTTEDVDRKLRGAVAQVKTSHLDAVDFTEDQTAGQAVAQGKSLVHAGDEDDALNPGGEEVAGGGEGAQHVDGYGQAAGLSTTGQVGAEELHAVIVPHDEGGLPSRTCGPYNTGVTKPADLIAYVFDGQPHLLSTELAGWMAESARFTAFIEIYRDKIRKKIRKTREVESILDLRSELEVAFGLLSDRRLEVTYEPYASDKRRGADFAVTYRANLVFNIEVARLRVEESELGEIDLGRKEERILRILLDKLGQMQAGMANVLVIHTREDLALSVNLNLLMQGLKTRVEARDADFFAASRYSSPGDFYKDFSHLSGIVFWSVGAQGWLNKQARPGLAEKVLRLIGSLPNGAGR